MVVSRVLFSFSRRKFSPLARRVSFLRQNQTGLRNLCPSVCAMANKNQSLPDSFIAFYLLRRYNPRISLLILNIPLLFFLFYPTPFLPSLSMSFKRSGQTRWDLSDFFPLSFIYNTWFFSFRSFLFFLFFFLFQEFERSISNRKTCSIFKGFTFHLFNIHTKFKREKLKIFFPSSLPTEKKRCKEINGFIKLRSLFD